MIVLLFDPFENDIPKIISPFLNLYLQLFILTFYKSIRKTNINNVFLSVIIAALLTISYETSAVDWSFTGHFITFWIYNINYLVLIPNLIITAFCLIYLYTKISNFQNTYKYILLTLIFVVCEIALILFMLNKYYFYEYIMY